MAEGTKQVVLGEVTIETIESPHTNLVSKWIPLTDAFSLGLSTRRPTDPAIGGFAFAGSKSDLQTFSWDWFKVDGPDHATKLQESGELRFALANPCVLWEIVETEFLTDISIRIVRFGAENPVNSTSWRIEILRGSHVRWPCVVDGRVSI